MGRKQEIVKETKNKDEKQRSNNGGVIITVYVESHEKSDPIKKIKPTPFPEKHQTTRSNGYNRRAQLLAYVQELRNAYPAHLHFPMNNSRPEPQPKKLKWWVNSETPETRRVSFRSQNLLSSSRRNQSCYRYERIQKDVHSTEMVDQLCRPKCLYGRSRNKATKENSSSSSFFKKIRSALRELSGGCKE